VENDTSIRTSIRQVLLRELINPATGNSGLPALKLSSPDPTKATNNLANNSDRHLNSLHLTEVANQATSNSGLLRQLNTRAITDPTKTWSKP